jgi:hypothetical protein
MTQLYQETSLFLRKDPTKNKLFSLTDIHTERYFEKSAFLFKVSRKKTLSGNNTTFPGREKKKINRRIMPAILV